MTCDSTTGRGCQPTSTRTARSSPHRLRPPHHYSSPSTTRPRSAAWGCHATCPANLALAGSRGSSLSVDHLLQPERPRPFTPLPTAIRRRITATTDESAGVPASVLCSLRIPPLGALPLTGNQPDGIGARLHTFRTRAWTGLMLPICRTPPGQ